MLYLAVAATAAVYVALLALTWRACLPLHHRRAAIWRKADMAGPTPFGVGDPPPPGGPGMLERAALALSAWRERRASERAALMAPPSPEEITALLAERSVRWSR